MIRFLLILFVLFTQYSSISAQIVTVLDSETKKPLESVSVFQHQKTSYGSTNADGKVQLTGFTKNSAISFRLIGYQARIISIENLEAANYRVFLNPDNLSMDELIVAANRWNQETDEIPVQVTKISPALINLENPQTSADLLGLSGQVFIQKSQQGGGSPMIRGFATNRLIYSVDGVRMNTAIFRGGNIQNVISLDPFAMEATEIVLGPNSVMFGSDAIGGTMAFETLKPLFSLDDNLFVSGSSNLRYASANGEQTFHTHVKTGTSNFASVTSVSRFSFDDLRMGANDGPDEYLKNNIVERQGNTDKIKSNSDPLIQHPSGYNQFNLMQKLRFRVHTNLEVNLDYHLSKISAYSRYDRHIRYENGNPRYGDWNYGPQRWQMLHFNAKHVANIFLYDRLSVRAAYQFFEESRISRDINKPIREIREEQVDAYSLNTDFTKMLAKNQTLFYGFEAVLNKVNSTGIQEDIIAQTNEKGPSRYPKADWNSLGVYLSHHYTLSEQYILQSGIRYSRFGIDAEFDTEFYPFSFTTSTSSDGAFSGSVGILAKPFESTQLSANLSTAFRSPNVDDIGKVFDSEPGAVTVPNPDLKAETVYSADVNLNQRIAEALNLDISVYYNYLDNAMVRRNFTLGGQDSIVYDGEMSQVQAIQNAAFAKIYGIHAGLSVVFPLGFSFRSDVNWQKGTEELEDGSTSPSRHAPPLFGFARLSYKMKAWEIQLSSNFSDGFDFSELPDDEKGKPEIYATDSNGNPYSPKWMIYSLKSTWEFNKNWQFTAGVENLLDKRYRPYSSGIVAAGRNIQFSVRSKL